MAPASRPSPPDTFTKSLMKTTTCQALSLTLKAFAEAELGPLRKARFCGWEHAESRVWRLVASSGKTAYLKAHRQDRKFKQELAAYTEWAPKLAPFTPKLLAVHEEEKALILSAAPGRLVTELVLSRREEQEVYRQAGRFLRRLHDLPFRDDDPMPPEEALRVRAAAWCERAAGVIDEEIIAWVREELTVSGRFDGLYRALCHRDFSPRNWLFERETNRLFVIDLEHARPDVPLTDLLKLWDGPWQEKPELEEVFFEGYGRSLSERERNQLRALAALHALATIVWSRDHADAAYEAHGWGLVERLRAGTMR
jgi:Ser/Thr protein kinase RdoA (MazF antagonist)